MRTSLTELVPACGSEEVQAAIDRVTAASATQDKKRFLVIFPKSPK